MRLAYIHTNSSSREIKNLVNDIFSNFNSDEYKLYEFQCSSLKYYKLSAIIKLKNFIKTNKIDIIHTFDYLDAFYALMASMGMKVKVVYSCYSYHEDLSPLYRRLFKYVLSHVDFIVFQTEIQRQKFISKYNLKDKKSSKLLHAFSMERYENFSFKSLRDEFFIDDFRYLIGTLGDFSPEHDVINIFKMIKKLRKTGRNFTCVVAGEKLEKFDSYYDECKYYYLIQGLDNYVNYVGRRENVANYLSQLDVFVYHSDNEPVALPVIEALISGVNVVVNDCEMIKEITFNGKYASLYKSYDPVDFADKTRHILLDLEDYKMIADTVKEECREIFSIQRHIFGLKEIYSKVNNC